MKTHYHEVIYITLHIFIVNTKTAIRLYVQRLAGAPTPYSTLTVFYEVLNVESSFSGMIGSELPSVSATPPLLVWICLMSSNNLIHFNIY